MADRDHTEGGVFMNPDQIRKWMKAHVGNYVDECNEVNATKLVEAWDAECGDGEETLDPDHIAWDIAAELAEEYDNERT